MQRSNEGTSKIPFFVTLIATGLYSGYIPFASGTFGSLVGVLAYLIPGMERPEVLCTAIAAGFAAGVITSAKVAASIGNQLSASAAMTKKHFQGGQGGHGETPDPSIVVIDEIVGMWISLAFLPKTPVVIVTAFILFRLFDIVKPPPARQLERSPNGWGIMLDDVMAGIYANCAVRIIILVFF